MLERRQRRKEKKLSKKDQKEGRMKAKQAKKRHELWACLQALMQSSGIRLEELDAITEDAFDPEKEEKLLSKFLEMIPDQVGTY